MMPPTWIIADPHVGERPERDALLRAVLRTAARGRTHLWLLGDLFDVWLGPDRFWTKRQRPVLEALRAIRAAGGRIDFVVGNRDYLTDAARGIVFDRVLHRPARVRVGGVWTWILHGDGIVRADRGYRAWRAVSRNRAVSAALRRLPTKVGQYVAERAHRSLASSGRRYKTGVLPVTALEDVGRRAARAGAKRALVGHFHHDRVLDVPDGVPVIVAPGFSELGRLIVAEGGRLVSTYAEDLLS